MNQKLKIGVTNILKIDRQSPHGFHLVTSDKSEDVLLPKAYITPSMQIGDEIAVFIYTDSEDRPVATTQTPIIQRGEFGYLKVIDTASIGAFVDWGLPKDLFVPKNIQKKPLQIGQSYIFYASFDEETGRLFADPRIGRYLNTNQKELHTLTKVDILVVAKTPLGFKVIANNAYEGMLYHNEIFEPIKTGDRKIGYVKKVRKDGKLDISLQPIGSQKQDLAKQKIMTLLNTEKFLPFTSKSDASLIQKQFGLSKKNFKAALVSLQEDGLIEMVENGIQLKG